MNSSCLRMGYLIDLVLRGGEGDEDAESVISWGTTFGTYTYNCLITNYDTPKCSVSL